MLEKNAKTGQKCCNIVRKCSNAAAECAQMAAKPAVKYKRDTCLLPVTLCTRNIAVDTGLPVTLKTGLSEKLLFVEPSVLRCPVRGTQNYNKPEMLQLNQQMHKCICRMCTEGGQAGHEIQEINIYCTSHCALGIMALNTGLPVTLKTKVQKLCS